MRSTHTLRTLRLIYHGTGAARGNVGPWCDHVKNMEWTKLDVLVPVALEGRRQSDATEHALEVDATEHDLTKPD